MKNANSAAVISGAEISKPRYQKERAAPDIGAAIPVMVRIPPALLKAIEERW